MKKGVFEGNSSIDHRQVRGRPGVYNNGAKKLIYTFGVDNY